MEKINLGSLTLLFETYCIINNISIETDEADNIYDEYYELDSMGMYFKEIGKYKVLSQEEEIEYLTRYKNGDMEARDIIIKHNLKLVISVVKKMRNRNYPMLDMIQEGNLGLFTAIKKFDVNKNVKFSTYAICWIKQAITRALADKSRIVRLPVYLHENAQKFKKIYDDLAKRNDEEPTIEEIAKEMNVSIDYASKLYYIQFNNLSLNSYVNEEKDTEFGDYLISSESLTEERLIEKEKKDRIIRLLDECYLTEKEKNVIILRYGFFGNKIYTLEEIAKMYGNSRERIRQIEAKALTKMRNYKNIYELLYYVNNEKEARDNIEKFRVQYYDGIVLGKPCKKKLLP